ARPRSRSSCTAFSMSPSASVRAFLASIIPAPVASRSALTSFAVISAMTRSLPLVGVGRCGVSGLLLAAARRGEPGLASGLLGSGLGTGLGLLLCDRGFLLGGAAGPAGVAAATGGDEAAF